MNTDFILHIEETSERKGNPFMLAFERLSNMEMEEIELEQVAPGYCRSAGVFSARQQAMAKAVLVFKNQLTKTNDEDLYRVRSYTNCKYYLVKSLVVLRLRSASEDIMPEVTLRSGVQPPGRRFYCDQAQGLLAGLLQTIADLIGLFNKQNRY
jgi:hypothetical protein